MNIDEVSPYIRVAMDSLVDAAWRIDERVIWDYELLYLKEGQLHVTIDDRDYYGKAGDCFFFAPGQRHAIQAIGGARVHQPHVHFDLRTEPDSKEIGVSFKPLEQMTAKERGWIRDNELNTDPSAIPSHFRPHDPRTLETLLFELIREYEAKPPFYELRLKGMLLSLLSHVLRDRYWAHTVTSSGHMELLSEIRTYIEHHAHRSLKLDELSERFHLSKFYLIHLFRTTFQLTPIQYHQQIRMEKAKSMIQYTGLFMQDIAELLGYANIHAFSRAFKAHTGCSPSDFRRL
ncbi:AraC family transcriptional regulator [Paenibacillus sp. R14(2021)]|uniref:AraC family transcriptional regulator n=1 Tax=Paenibacillus sp. R14(2021) TaxID=2859228 RepID=UPI001C6156CA|nr:AraC family transcriptional regulator [Paenibacillus sp. R14(2021)]